MLSDEHSFRCVGHRDGDHVESRTIEAETTDPSGNCYRIDGRVVDADAALTRPDVLVEDPAATYQDCPDR